jgi:hypothetical protein
MSILETIADELARDALRLEEELNDLDVVEQIAKQIGTSSPTVEEAFRTAVRMRRAEQTARRMIARLRGRGAGSGSRPEPERPANLPARRGGIEGKS